MLVIVVIFAYFSYVNSYCPPEENETWSYNRFLPNGPDFWGANYPKCYGRKQSPIKILSGHVVLDPSLDELQLTNYDVPVTKFKIENNGHTVQLTPLDGIVRSVEVKGRPYYLDQIHFHWGDAYFRGAEHIIDGIFRSMEIHFVHSDENKRIAVIGVLYQETPYFYNNALRPISSSLDKVPYRGDEVELDRELHLDFLIPISHRSFYRYEGSLTTPGCDEGVTWSLCKAPMIIGTLQITKFRKLNSFSKDNPEDISECSLVNNFRPTQPLNGRLVTASL